MPIKRIQREILDRGVLGNMPRWGKLRKGAEKPENGPGRDLDHFRLTLEPEYEFIRPEFERLFTAKPTEFRGVLIAADNADKAFDYWHEQHTASKLTVRCDGEEIVQWFDEGMFRNSYERKPCTCNPLNRECGEVGRLDIVLPELCAVVGWGKLTVVTSSDYDIRALAASMFVAGQFLQQLPQIAFWSIPFTIGRAPRKVPVTMTDKKGQKSRNNKIMSLLYAEIDTEFQNTVLTPMLTRPAQQIMSGLTPNAGELPEVIIEQPAAWDWDYVNEQTLHLFDHENHQTNAINQMIAFGLITDDMSDETVIARIQIHRAQRDAEKQTEQPAQNAPKTHKKGSKRNAAQEQVQVSTNYSPSTPALQKIVEAAIRYDLTVDDVFKAVSAISPVPMQSLDGFAGTSQEAWAAIVAYKAGYSLQTVAELIPDPENATRKLAEQIIQSKQPF